MRVWEIFPNRVAGRPIPRKLVSEDGLPLSAERAAQELKRLAAEIEKDEREAARRSERGRGRLSKAGLRVPGYVPPGGPDCTRSGYVTAFGNNGGLARVDSTRAPALFDGVNVYFNGVFSDYRRFGTVFDSYKLAAPKAQD